MKKRFCQFFSALVFSVAVMAQDDPVVMHINGVPVTRSEFEYNYNKNNVDGVIDKKTAEEYTQLFINYKLKVLAATDAHLDTLTSFKKEFRTYRDQQIRPMLVPETVVEDECRAYYERMLQSLQGKELIRPAHIFLRVPQTATTEEQQVIKNRIDSVYAALNEGADFAELAQKVSEDHQTAKQGGLLPWIGPNQTLKEFEDVVYSLELGCYSAPFLSTVGYHIVKLDGRRPLESYDSLRTNIRRYLEAQGLQDKLAVRQLETMSQQAGGHKTVEQILDEETERLCAEDLDLKYLVKEYHDGLLLFEICTREVWEPASKDTAALERYFKKNKKKYVWKEPRFRGMMYYCREKDDVKAVKKTLKRVPENDWTSVIREKFNKDSVMVRMERRMFKKGDNPNLDAIAFKDKKAKIRPLKDFPYAAIIGKVLKKGPESWTDVSSQVVSDYQRMCEDAFVEELRERYTVEVHEDVLKTVNKH